MMTGNLVENNTHNLNDAPSRVCSLGIDFAMANNSNPSATIACGKIVSFDGATVGVNVGDALGSGYVINSDALRSMQVS